MDSLIGKPMPGLSELGVELTEEDKASQLVWEARDLPVDKGRRRAKKALKLNPDCIEAYEYLGDSYSYYDKRQEYLEKGVEIGRRIFGGQFMKENKGHFWLVPETRPFMRCLAGLAECYYGPGQTHKAIEIWEEMLRLNPGDNQGIRYVLLPALLEKKELAKYEKHRKEYDEGTAMMEFSDALYLFMKNGDTSESVSRLKSAISNNKFVPRYLLAEYPPEEFPFTYSLHSEEEAIIYAGYAWRAWLWAEGARDWLRKVWRGAK